MATFKDIAIEAGVSYGTVSNVMNGKGIVSSDKVKRVQEAAARLGYAVNLDAQQLRKGKSNLLAIIIPNIGDTHYADFYLSFRNYAESAGYRVSLNLHDGIPQREKMLLQEVRATKPAGTVVISSLFGPEDAYSAAGYTPDELLFAEQRPYEDYDYVGFDFRKIGQEMGRRACKYQRVALLTEATESHVTKELTAGFMEEAGKVHTCHVQHYQKESSVRSAALALDILSSSSAPEAVFAANYSHADTISNIHKRFFADQQLDIYTTSHLFTMPEVSFQKYELNYRLLGKASAEQLIARCSGTTDGDFQKIILPGTGFRTWNPGPIPEKASLTMLTLDSPTANIMKQMARLYKTYTGVDVQVKIFSYDGVHELLSNLNEDSPFDIIRLDATWLSWFAPKIFEPLDQMEHDFQQLNDQFIPGMMERYGGSHGNLYALPETPSTQMLFYRRDLFEDTVIRRLYQEQMHEPLVPPRTFAEYNRIASFFTRSLNPQSPTEYGSTMTLGNTGTAATEFLSRYFALNHDLFDEKDHVLLNTPEGRQALSELVECSRYINPELKGWWRDTAKSFAEGDTAMTILYGNYASEIIGKNSVIRGQIGFSMVPGGNPMFGGGSIGVSRYSKHKELAYHFIRWLCGEQVSSAMTLLGSVSPCKGTYDNYQIIDTYPWLSMTNECFEKTDAHRQPHDVNVSFDERRFLEVLGTQVLSALNGICSVEQALENADRYYQRIG